MNNTPDPGIKNFQTYIESQQHMAAKAAATGATVLLSNHSEKCISGHVPLRLDVGLEILDARVRVLLTKLKAVPPEYATFTGRP